MMHLYKNKKKLPYSGLFLTILIFGILVLYLLFNVYTVSDTLKAQQKESLKAAIDRAVVTCYAIEGVYPPDLSYLKEHYGIAFDEEKYYVIYDSWSSNIKPDIQVLWLEEEKK